MQIYGRKQFIVYPPEQEPFLYPSPEKENLSLLDSVESLDLEKFPLFAKAESTAFILEPGEMVFVPSHWWHTTRMLTPCITISASVFEPIKLARVGEVRGHEAAQSIYFAGKPRVHGWGWHLALVARPELAKALGSRHEVTWCLV